MHNGRLFNSLAFSYCNLLAVLKSSACRRMLNELFHKFKLLTSVG